MKRLISIILTGSLVATVDATNVRDFGAKGDGRSIDSGAINEAIARAAESDGEVVVPEGTYMCYSIHLRSGVRLRIEKGAVLKAAKPTETEGYDEAEPNDSKYQDYGHSHWHNSMIWGEGLENVSIEGEGMIDGTDVLLRHMPRRGQNDERQANKALAMRECRSVTIRGVMFLNCGHFAMLMTGVDDLLIEGVTADTNRDGFDIDCCERVVVRGCTVNTVNDDAIVLKCSYALGREKPTENVVVEDCHVSGYDAGTVIDGSKTTQTTKAPDGDGPTGRIKLGTESNGGFRDIVIRRCTFEHCRGLALETVDGAAMDGIRVSDIEMKDICNSPIYIRLGDRMRAPEGFHFSTARDIRIEDVKVSDADSRYACLIAGVEGHPVKDVELKDITIEYRGGLTMDDYKEQRGVNPFFVPEARKVGRHGESNYPEPSAHGIQPAWGIAIYNADGVKLKNIKMRTAKKDERPAIHIENAKGIVKRRVRTRQAQ
ncbi:MAG: right-handed parallel beta-helix repeat-containing protein [Bacteroidales bacterium]|nr:right-handed parallel beta-helix repeat-containing protein [Bacteroidales bacterium]